MQAFQIGQRWISLAEPELGLGVIKDSAHRRVQVYFPLIEDTRLYSADNTPLIRGYFQPGDLVLFKDGISYRILDRQEKGQRFEYKVSDDRWVSESEVAANQGKISPLDRLEAGQLGSLRLRDLYHDVLAGHVKHQGNLAHGFVGPKINLIPHQYDVAQQVLNMPLPRALLADEVGLGKTIEAGLVIHQLLVGGRAERILICVPASLINQWLVEMKRKFNLDCTLVDDEFCAEQQGINPFAQVQLALCNFDWLQHSEYLPQAIEAGWDMLVIDESHRLQWQSKAYQSALTLSQASSGVLLLTATPEQLGVESHFARLHLLDPNRFPDLEQFLDEEQQYGRISNIVDIVELGSLADALPDIEQLNDAKLIDRAAEAVGDPELEQKFIEWMVDRYGTGRMVYRNTRRTIQGFPVRHTEFYHQKELSNLEWLLEWLPELDDKKVLLICHSAETAQKVVDAVNSHTDVEAGAFHEGYSLIERDQIAAQFVEEDGIQLLACSEIGGEGRNFQHAQHLVLFDMPDHPDLVDQRIGRLDRIGQGDNIYIHIPVRSGSPQARLTALFHHGFDMFAQPNPAAAPIFEAYLDDIIEMVAEGTNAESVILQCQEASNQLLIEIEQGRDKLLEQHSFSQERISPLLSAIESLDQQQHQLAVVMESAFDVGHVDTEYTENGNTIISPSENTPFSFVNSMRDEKATLTYDRQQAALREDLEFISWDHPWVKGLMDDLEAAGSAFTSCSLFSHPEHANGKVFVEAFFVTKAQGPGRLELTRYFKPALNQYVISEDLKSLASTLTPDVLRDSEQRLSKEMAREVIQMKWPQIKNAVLLAEKLAMHHNSKAIEASVESMLDDTRTEVARYESLEIHPGSFAPELNALNAKAEESATFLAGIKPQLAGISIWVNYLQ